ncbi:MAG: cytochrome P450 [Actinomycetota bacterium]|nr:cytochrome P450 [Actinomycetota bacterium]
MRLEDIDLTDLDRFVAGFPHEELRTLRHEAPVWWHRPTVHTPDGVGFWVLSRHADVLAAASDAKTFSSERAPGADGGGTILQDLPYGFAAGVLLNMTDDPRHHRVRRLVTPAVSPKALAAMEAELTARARAILDTAADSVESTGSCDFLSQVAVELPIQATLQLLGVPAADRHLLVAWTNATLAYEDRELGEETSATQEAATAMASYAEALIADKRARPAEDILSVLVHAQVEGEDGRLEPLSALELTMFFSLLIAAGSETTRNAIALGVAALIEHPDQLAALTADRSLLASATEEILRWTSPTLYNRRTVTAPTELGGEILAAGDKVTLWWMSANFDESVFADPFTFDIRRDPNPHLAFGFKSHFCLGANLARMEIRIMVRELLDRFEGFVLEGPITRVRTNKHAGVSHMPVSFRRKLMPPST